MVGLHMNNSEQQISIETALELLIKQQRRQILRRMADTTDGIPVDRLTRHLREANSPRPDGNGSAQRRGIELHHVHLPKLRDANVIEHDTDQGIVRRGAAFREVLALLEAIDDHRECTPTTTS